MSKNIFKIIISFMLCSLFGCSVSSPKIYHENKPNLDIRKYFDGKVEAHGMVKDWKGKVSRRFSVEMNGKWQENTGTIKEKFVFDDGEVQYRDWQFDFIDENNFSGKANDTTIDARGQQFGNTVRMDYQLKIYVDKKPIKVNIEDWLYLIDDKYLINESKIKKFGLTLGYLNIFFIKQQQPAK